MSLSNYLETALLNHAFRGTAYTQPSALFLALFTADPTDTGSFTNEVPTSGSTNYERREFTGSVSGHTFTAGTIPDFPAAGGSGWGTITHVAITDSGTEGAGNMLASAALTTPRTVNNGDIYRQTSLTVTLD